MKAYNFIQNYFMKLIPTFLFTFIITVLLSCNTNNNKSFKSKLQEVFPNAKINTIKTEDHFIESYQVILNQFLDHKHPEEGTFKQYIYISHSDYNNPTILVTDGYASHNRTTELSKIFKGNQVIVEYRMYGKSRPDEIPWKYLTNDNATNDYHFIVEKLKSLYKNKWISTGISKGGETALIYKYNFPNDIDVTVPYVAPLINGTEDIRTNDFINTIKNETCRDRIKTFQRAILHKRSDIIPLLKEYATTNEITFNEVPFNEVLEYAVLEFPFSFWQWGDGKCDKIPENNDDINVLFNFLIKNSDITVYSDWGYNYYLPSFYQHMTELGYYGYDLTPVKDLLQVVTSSSNKRFAPKNIDISYNPNYIKKVRNYVENKGNRILYIYGENDPWYACAPIPKKEVDALKMVLPNANHATRIRHFSDEKQKIMYDKLQAWLGNTITIYPLKK
ncbi:hypothetical protein MHM83_09080 [Tenacibaculum sp. Mcav3-52]|uniref:PS-10 peptidase S37 n=2 Tax=Tenacibaculum mesophilum TaxID=104268 RepID=A0ABM7CI82_9FLAO|nr:MULTISPECIES: S28 family serine protease [Tenacibaculum]AZJ33515.1 hypothetical protein D6200_13450 [Tenacibaculum mesophilum]MCG7502022.1 hypothetical protein [Tenacibaculum sp. Mcav3-52]QFS28755.1 hypothetical protein F9Y86_10260 [Tenacibaculum mesophilum]SHF59278.1 PS-10 peptidase S37 [Tenacibaculum mesophilum]BFF38804.1 S28 family serine protease [Tenacibaculum mesophilum]